MENSYATSYVSVIVTNLVSCTVSEIWQEYWSNFHCRQGVPVFNALVVVYAKIQDCKILSQKLDITLSCGVKHISIS